MPEAFRERLQREFEERKERNHRYSLRTFAAFLETDHSVLSQIFKGKRRAPVAQIRKWAKKLGWSSEEATAYVTAAHTPEPAVFDRQRQLRHWASEALGVVGDRTHLEIMRLSRSPGFQNDSRWIAAQAGVSVDQVNVALSRLLRLRLLEMTRAGVWRDRTGLMKLTEAGFRKLALARVREMAAAFAVKVPPAEIKKK